MILVRLCQWAFRVPTLPTPSYDGKLRPPTFYEAWTGISHT